MNKRNSLRGIGAAARVAPYIMLLTSLVLHLGLALVMWKYFPHIYERWVGDTANVFFGRMIAIILCLGSYTFGLSGVANFNDGQKGNGFGTVLTSLMFKGLIGWILYQFFIDQSQEAMVAILKESGRYAQGMLPNPDMIEVPLAEKRAILSGPITFIVFAFIAEVNLMKSTAGKLTKMFDTSKFKLPKRKKSGKKNKSSGFGGFDSGKPVHREEPLRPSGLNKSDRMDGREDDSLDKLKNLAEW